MPPIFSPRQRTLAGRRRNLRGEFVSYSSPVPGATDQSRFIYNPTPVPALAGEVRMTQFARPALLGLALPSLADVETWVTQNKNLLLIGAAALLLTGAVGGRRRR